MRLYISAAIAKYEKPCVIYYCDGNGSASRGMEPDHIGKLTGYACSPEVALVASLNIDTLENGFTTKDILDEIMDDSNWSMDFFEFEDPEDFNIEEINAKGCRFWINKIYEIDMTGGWLFPYKVQFNGETVFYDTEIEASLEDAVSNEEEEAAWYERKREETYAEIADIFEKKNENLR